MGASCRAHGGSSFELDAGSGLGLTGAALTSASMARLSSAWPYLLEWVEDGLRAARLDRIRGIGYIETCVGGILNFFQRANFTAAVSKIEGFSRREGLRGM